MFQTIFVRNTRGIVWIFLLYFIEINESPYTSVKFNTVPFTSTRNKNRLYIQ